MITIGMQVTYAKQKYEVVEIRENRMFADREVVLELVDFGGPKEVLSEEHFRNMYCK